MCVVFFQRFCELLPTMITVFLSFVLLQAVAYFINLMEPIVRREYVFVYFHTESDPENQPDGAFFKELYALLDER